MMLQLFITESKKHEFECILADPYDQIDHLADP